VRTRFNFLRICFGSALGQHGNSEFPQGREFQEQVLRINLRKVSASLS